MNKSYKPNNRLLKLFLRQNFYLVIGFIVLTPAYFYIKEGEKFEWNFLYVKIMAIVLLVWNLPLLFIILDYYLENKNTKFSINTESEIINIEEKGKLKSYKFSEIKSSIYHLGIYYKNRIDKAGRFWAFNSDLAYWHLEFNNGDKYYISNLLVDFLHDEPIIEDTKYKFRLFQFINKSGKFQFTNKVDPKEAVELHRDLIENEFERLLDRYNSKSKNQLLLILEQRKSYRKEAIKAAKKILKEKYDTDIG